MIRLKYCRRLFVCAVIVSVLMTYFAIIWYFNFVRTAEKEKKVKYMLKSGLLKNVTGYRIVVLCIHVVLTNIHT